MLTKDPRSILIIEDELLIAKDIETTLNEAGYLVSGIASNVKEAINLFESEGADLIICDVNLNDKMDGIDLARQLIGMHPAKVLFLTAYSDEHNIEKALAVHPSGYITKPFNDKQLLTSVKMAFRHFNKESINRLDLLSHREKEIAKHITDGLSNKQIGESLFISEDTVKTHRKIIKKKLEIQNPSDWYEYKDYLL